MIFYKRFFYFIFMNIAQFPFLDFCSYWRKQSIFYWKSLFQPSLYKSSRKSELFSPSSNAKSFSLVSYIVIISSIILLYLMSWPAAILLAIMSICIISINACIILSKLFGVCSIRTKHVFVKTFKSHPFITNMYSSSSVIWKSIMLRVQTSLFYTAPNLVKSSTSHIMFHKNSLRNI